MEISDIHDQASLDQYWAEHGGAPLTVAQERSLVVANEAVVLAAVEWRVSLTKGIEANLPATAKLLTTLEIRDSILTTRTLDENLADAVIQLRAENFQS